MKAFNGTMQDFVIPTPPASPPQPDVLVQDFAIPTPPTIPTGTRSYIAEKNRHLLKIPQAPVGTPSYTMAGSETLLKMPKTTINEKRSDQTVAWTVVTQ